MKARHKGLLKRGFAFFIAMTMCLSMLQMPTFAAEAVLSQDGCVAEASVKESANEAADKGSGNDESADKTSGNDETVDKTSGNDEASDKASGNDEASDKASGNDEAADKASGNDEAADKVSGNDESADKVSGNDESADKVSGNDESVDKVSGNDESVDKVSGNDEATDNVSDNKDAGDVSEDKESADEALDQEDASEGALTDEESVDVPSEKEETSEAASDKEKTEDATEKDENIVETTPDEEKPEKESTDKEKPAETVEDKVESSDDALRDEAADTILDEKNPIVKEPEKDNDKAENQDKAEALEESKAEEADKESLADEVPDEQKTPKKIPAEVKAFLDAVAAIPEITPDNAEEMSEYLYGEVAQFFEDLLGTEYEDRKDVQAAAAAMSEAMKAVDAALEMESELLASGYIPVENVTINPDKKPTGQTVNGKVRQSGQSLTMQVGQKASFLLGAPTNTLIGRSCRHTIAVYNPSDYCDISLIGNSKKELVGNPTYKAGNNNGIRVFDTIFEALKPGKSNDVRVCYYANFGIVFTNPNLTSAYVSCPVCGSRTLVYKDVKWYRYNDVFGITVNADYMLEYDTQGGSAIDPTNETTSASTANLEITVDEPTRDGYTFLGWSERADAEHPTYKAGDLVVLSWENDGKGDYAGSKDNPVKKTLYAVWEKNGDLDETPEAPKRTDLYGILGKFVEVKCVSEGENLPHEEKTYSTWTGSIDGQYEASVGSVYLTIDGVYKVDVTLYGKVYVGMYGAEPDFGVGKDHKLAENEDETKTITLKWDANSEKWKEENGNPKKTVLATFEVVCKEEPDPEAEYTVIHEYYTNDKKDGEIKKTITDKKVNATIKAEEIEKITTYDDKTYEYKLSTPDEIVLKENSEKNVITLRYERTETTKPDPEPEEKETKYTIIHEYYTNDKKDGEIKKTITDEKVNATIKAEEIEKITTYDGKTYEYKLSTPAEIVLKENSEENVITLRYERTETTKPDPDPNPDPDPGPNPDPDPDPNPDPNPGPGPEPNPGPGPNPDPGPGPNPDPGPGPNPDPGPGPNPDPGPEPTPEPIETKAKYTVEWYDASTNEWIKESETRSGIVDREVSVTEGDKHISGYTFVPKHENNILTALVAEDNRTVLKLYFTKDGEGTVPTPTPDPQPEEITYIVIHEYYTNGTKDGERTLTISGKKVGDTVRASDIGTSTSYDGKLYRHTSTNPEDLVLTKDSDNNVLVLRYDRTVGSNGGGSGGGGGGGSTATNLTGRVHRGTPEPAVTVPGEGAALADIPEGTDIPDEDVPLAAIPETDIPDADVPLAGIPDFMRIPDDDVPLASVPKTGDSSGVWHLMALLSAAGLMAISMLEKKRHQKEK